MIRLAVLVALVAPAGQAETERKMTGDEILATADERIRRYRMADGVVRVVDADGKPLAGATTQVEQVRHAFLFGCNIFKLGRCKTKAQEAEYRRRFAALLNYATLPFYWWGYEPQQGKPDYPRTEQIIRWCRAHGITMKGHPLVWNYNEPAWLPDDPEQVKQLQLQRVFDCVRRFRGKIDIWDVVNEATHFDRPELFKQAAKLTRTWQKYGRAGFAVLAFQAARQANPNATLLINDYRTDEAYAETVISRLVDEQGRRVYDVIGIQSHMHGGVWSTEQIWQVCERFARFGVPLHFTETTILSGQQGWELKKQGKVQQWSSTPEGEAYQARQVVRFYTVLFSHPAVEAITWWDFTDQNAWQGAPAGLLREDMSPKPAYEELMKLIKGKWWTKRKLTTDAQGRAKFRGFLGRYKVVVQTDAQTRTRSFELTRDGPNEVVVRMGAAERGSAPRGDVPTGAGSYRHEG